MNNFAAVLWFFIVLFLIAHGTIRENELAKWKARALECEQCLHPGEIAK